MALLAARLRAAGFETAQFAYFVTFESYGGCRARLQRFVQARIGRPDKPKAPYVLIGHSLGSVLLRAIMAQLQPAPAALFLLAPPTCACHLARVMAPQRIYRVLCGEMGQLLADAAFMNDLPVPQVPTWIYAGTAGPRGSLFPVGDECNDGILKLSETALPGIAQIPIHAMHTFLPNTRALAAELIPKAKACVFPGPVTMEASEEQLHA
jgi:hypothetical protein